MIDISDLEAVAREAGEEAARLFGVASAQVKEDGSLVTQADLASQEIILRRLRELEPDPHRLYFLAEEQTAHDPNPGVASPVNAELVAAVDPLDGTSVYAAGVPLWSVSIGLIRGCQPVAGVVHQPLLGGRDGWLFRAGASGPATLNAGRLQVPDFRGWTVHSQIAVPSGFFRFARLVGYPGRVRSLGSTALHIALAAGGMIDAAIVGRAWVWDMAAGAALLERAGGVLRTASGGPVRWTELMSRKPQREPLLAGSAAAVEALARLLRSE